MAIIEIPHTQQKLNNFAADNWDKTLAYLQDRFSLSRSDCEDIFTEAFTILHNKITSGELTLTAKPLTYFIGICRNKAFEKIRENRKTVNIIDEHPDVTKDEYEDERINRLLVLEKDSEMIEIRKEALVREIVSQLPAPCDKILWGFYRDGFSMKTLAQMYKYSSAGSVKVTKHRCAERFKARYMEKSKELFD